MTTVAGLRDLSRGVHEHGRFADARLATDQDEAAGNDATAQHAVELRPGKRGPGRILGRDLAEPDDPSSLEGPRLRFLGGLPHLELLQRVPGPAVRTLAGPAKALASTFGADKGDGRFGHRQTVYP